MVHYWPRFVLLPGPPFYKKKEPSLKVVVHTPDKSEGGSHPLINYNMPVIPPGEDLKDKEKFKIPQEILDAMNKLKKSKARVRRKKPKEIKKPKPKKKIIGYHTICLKWIVGVLVNRHFANKKQWQFKDAVFDKDGKFRYCKKWGKLPIYDKNHLEKKAKKKKSGDKNVLCNDQLSVILNLSEE